MNIAILIKVVIAVDCFRLNTFASYSAQRSLLRFSATPSKELIGEDKNLCENIINQQQFTLQVSLGNVVFQKSGMTYNKENKINVALPCLGNVSNCGIANVQNVQAATYTMIFNDLDLQLTSIINFYQIRRYNHLSCIQTANLIYDGIKKTMDVEVVDPVIHCPCNLAQPIPTSLPNQKKNVYVISKLSGVALSQHGYNNTTYDKILTFSNNGQSTHQPSAPDKFWTELIKFGQYTSTNLPGISILLEAIRNKPVLELAMRVTLLTEIKQNRDQQNPGKGKDPFYYNQSIEFSISRLTNINQGDCYTGVDVELHKNFFYINTAQNQKAKNCSREFIENKTGKPYEYIMMQIIGSQNLDKTGFNYYQDFNLTDFQLGQDIQQRFYCKDEEDCDKLTQITNFQHQNLNFSVSVKLLFMYNNSISFAITYSANFYLTSYNKTTVSVLDQRICLDVKPHKTGTLVADFQLFGYYFDLSQYMNQDQSVYCSELTQNQQKDILKIITKMRGNTPVAPQSKLSVGNKIVGDLDVIVYHLPKNNSLVYVALAVIFVITFGCALGVGFGFQKTENLWMSEQLHIIES